MTRSADDLDSAFASHSGGIYFATRTAGLLLWQDGKIRVLPDRNCTPSLRTDGIAEDNDGSLWIQNRAGLAHLSGTTCERIGVSQGYPGGFVAAILIDHRGTLWIMTKSGMLLSRPQGEKILHTIWKSGTPTLNFVFMHEASNGAIWVADDTGLHPITDSNQLPVTDRAKKHKVAKNEFGNFAFAPNGVLWAGTNEGLARFQDVRNSGINRALDENVAQMFTEDQGLSSTAVWKILVDREGSVWIASNGGLDQLRSTPFNPIHLPGSQQTQIGLGIGKAGAMWFASRTLPLTEMTAAGRRFTYPRVRLVTCIRSDMNGTIWAAGNSHLWRISDRHPQLIHYPRETERDVAAMGIDKNKDLWLLLFWW